MKLVLPGLICSSAQSYMSQIFLPDSFRRCIAKGDQPKHTKQTEQVGANFFFSPLNFLFL